MGFLEVPYSQSISFVKIKYRIFTVMSCFKLKKDPAIGFGLAQHRNAGLDVSLVAHATEPPRKARRLSEYAERGTCSGRERGWAVSPEGALAPVRILRPFRCQAISSLIGQGG